MSVVGIHHAQVNVSSEALELARAFYVGFLGLKQIARPAVFTSEGIWLNAGSFELHIGMEDGVDRHLTRAHLAFEVKRLDDWRRKIDANGWPITEQPKMDGYDRLHFRDPFGNNIELIQRESA